MLTVVSPQFDSVSTTDVAVALVVLTSVILVAGIVTFLSRNENKGE